MVSTGLSPACRETHAERAPIELIPISDKAPMSCELRFHGESYGWEARIFERGELHVESRGIHDTSSGDQMSRGDAESDLKRELDGGAADGPDSVTAPCAHRRYPFDRRVEGLDT
jgi:hypothetical protein